MATENFKTLREVAIAIDGVKSVIEGIKSQLALMTLVFAGFAAASVAAFGYFFVISVSNTTAIARLEAGQEAHTVRFDGIDKRLDGIERRVDQVIDILQTPKQQRQLEGGASANAVGGHRP
jgi:hypothetical protein